MKPTTSPQSKPPARRNRWFRLLDPRRSRRQVDPPLVAYYWSAGSPQAHGVADISCDGLHLLTEERWPQGSTVSMTLQRTDEAKGTPESWIAVDLRIIRWCEDGLAGAFIPTPHGMSGVVVGRAGNCADRRTLERFVRHLPPDARP